MTAKHLVAVIGAGPAGLFGARELAAAWSHETLDNAAGVDCRKKNPELGFTGQVRHVGHGQAKTQVRLIAAV